MTESSLNRFSDELLQFVAKLIAETRTGSEITEFFRVAGYPHVQHDGSTKWRFVYAALHELNQSKGGPGHVARIIEKLADPKQYIGTPQIHARVAEEVNRALFYDGLALDVENRIEAIPPGSEAPRRLRQPHAPHLDLFDRMAFHPEVVRASRSLFESGHYPQAIFEAYKALNNFVKGKSGVSHLDGQALMGQVFGTDEPTIRLNPLETKSDRDEQDGFKFLYMGAMTGIRNPKAHDSVQQRDPVRALKYLALASLLIERADEGTTNQGQ